MRTGLIRKSLPMFCLLLPAFLAGAFAAAENGTPSVLRRAQRVDDPELSEVIQAALDNSRTPPERRFNEKETLEMIRKVTESYAQIKLLDQQIEQTARRIKSASGPAEVRSELLLAKAELESKRTVELARLREAMGIIPRRAFGGDIKLTELRSYLELDIIDNRVFVIERIPPFTDIWDRDKRKAVKVMSRQEVLDYVKSRLEDKHSLPTRIMIYRTPEAIDLSHELCDAILALARQAKAEMETELRMPNQVREMFGEFVFTLKPGTVPTIEGVYARDGRPVKTLVDMTQESPGYVDPNHPEGFLARQLISPGRLPARFRIVYPPQMKPLAERLAHIAEDMAKKMGITELLSVTLTVQDQNKQAP